MSRTLWQRYQDFRHQIIDPDRCTGMHAVIYTDDRGGIQWERCTLPRNHPGKHLYAFGSREHADGLR